MSEKTKRIEDYLFDALWTVPVPEQILQRMGYNNLSKSSYNLAYEDTIYYFQRGNRFYGFIKIPNKLMFPNDNECYKQVSEGSECI